MPQFDLAKQKCALDLPSAALSFTETELFFLQCLNRAAWFSMCIFVFREIIELPKEGSSPSEVQQEANVCPGQELITELHPSARSSFVWDQ